MATATSNGVKPMALLSVSDKTGLLELARGLHDAGVRLIGSGGTAQAIRDSGIDIEDVSAVTGAPEMLGGRVKTLHPAVHGGILARRTEQDLADLAKQSIHQISIVVCNLYPFQDKTSNDTPIAEAVELVDIGGVTLLRAAAKNHERVTILCDPADYSTVLTQIKSGDVHSITDDLRKTLAVKAFSMTATYDDAISNYFRRKYNSADHIESVSPDQKSLVRERVQQLSLRYGVNPHQFPAQTFISTGQKLPFSVLSGSPGYINLLDALNSFALVRELCEAFLPKAVTAAASFKHVSPAGVAIGTSENLSEVECKVFDVVGMDQTSRLAKAYARARGADRMSSFGDFIALSHTCDVATAKIISKEVSDGVVAPGYEPEALEILRKKKNGKYCVLQMDPSFEPSLVERRQVYGVTLEQRRNDVKITPSLFQNITSTNKTLPESAMTDLIVATCSLKYTQSNSVAYSFRGGIVGLGSGQQSRIHCTRLAGSKTDAWWMRHHPQVVNLQFKKNCKRADRSNAIDVYVTDTIWESEVNDTERKEWESLFEQVPTRISKQERQDWMSQLKGVALASDAFFPFTDNVRRAARSGVGYIAAPGGSVMDGAVFKAADETNMVYCNTGLRLFHH